MITTIIFDIGNVLADFTWKEHYKSFGYDDEMVERIAVRRSKILRGMKTTEVS